MLVNVLFTSYMSVGGYIAVRACCCLTTPMTLASGPIFQLVVHQPASPGPVHKSRGDNVVGAVEEMMCVVCGCYRGGIVVMDVFWRRLCVSMISWLDA